MQLTGTNVSWKIKRTFFGCNTSKKSTLILNKILLVLIKKREGSGLTPKYTEFQKVKR